ncbi:MAG: membrane dipeptidase [Clostridia bacterium]|nr:membrane dipeptidase [Clostridia bacterium]
MFIADTHCDTLFAMGVLGLPDGKLMVTPEKMRKGGIGLQTLALWTGSKGNRGDVAGIVQKELEALPRLTDAGIRRVVDPSEAMEAGEPCCMLSVEGGEVFEAGLSTVAEYRARGVRMAALLWNNANAIGFPAKSGDPHGLTAYGLEVVREMQRVGMAVDTSHLNEAGFWDIVNRTDVPPMASHSCCMSLCRHFRNLTDEQIRALIRGGGYIGVNFYPAFLSEDGEADAARVAEHIDHICQLGGEDIVGFGSDFDGIEKAPRDLRGADEVPNLLDSLRRRGYPEEKIEGIAGLNLVRYFGRIA